jgi:hypothetical protein
VSIPKNKIELIHAIITEYEKLRAELETIPDNLAHKNTLEKGGSVCDVVAYQIGWGTLLLGWHSVGKKGDIPVLPAQGYKWNQLGSLAQKFYADYSNKSFKQLLSLFDETVRNILKMVHEQSEVQLYEIGVYAWTAKWPLGRWINVNTSSPYKSARAKIRAWKKQEHLM